MPSTPLSPRACNRAGVVRDAARSEMRSAFTVKRNSFISSMGVKVFDKEAELLPALLVGSKIPGSVCMKKAAR